MRPERAVLGGVLIAIALLGPGTAARAGRAATCEHRVVLFTLPGVTWEEARSNHPEVLLSLVDRGAIGSISVRTVSSRTSYASGFATIGAGNRLDGGFTSGTLLDPGVPSDLETVGDDTEVAALFADNVVAGGLSEMRERAEADAYGAIPGALGSALHDVVDITALGNADIARDPPAPAPRGRYTLLAAMDRRGVVEHAAVGPRLLAERPGAPYGVATDPVRFSAAIEGALSGPCRFVVIDQGDLIRAELATSPVDVQRSTSTKRDALHAADEALATVVSHLDPAEDLLIVLAPTSPLGDDAVHFGLAIVVGAGFEPGSVLNSASTRRQGMVTLPDVAPTILESFDVARPGSMAGRPMVDEPSAETDRIGAAIELDRESVFVDRVRTPAVTAYVIFQIAVYVLIYLVLRKERSATISPRMFAGLEVATLSVVAFPLATYILGILDGHQLGSWWFGAILVSTDVGLVALVSVTARRSLDRLLLLTGATALLLFVDLMTGSDLQLNTVLSYSPLVAGRFAGLGNIAFGVLTGAVLVTGTLLLHRYGVTRRSVTAVVILFLLAIVVDGAPDYGSDVGGVIALVPGLAISLMLLLGKKPNWRILALSVLAMFVAVGVFLAVDLARPPEQHTHLARLYESVRDEGVGALSDTILRKVRTNLRVFRTTIWTYGVPPALGVIAWLLLRPRGRWRSLATTYPRLQAGLIGGLVLAALGFAVNDSGIVVPAVILAFLVPMALIIHLNMTAEDNLSASP